LTIEERARSRHERGRDTHKGPFALRPWLELPCMFCKSGQTEVLNASGGSELVRSLGRGFPASASLVCNVKEGRISPTLHTVRPQPHRVAPSILLVGHAFGVRVHGSSAARGSRHLFGISFGKAPPCRTTVMLPNPGTLPEAHVLRLALT
jgi:hypothetical protein